MKKYILSAFAVFSLIANAQNTMQIQMQDGSVQSVNTSSVSSVDFESGNNFSYTADDGQISQFNGTAKHISFAKKHYIDGTSATTIAKSIGLGWNMGNNFDAHNNGVSSETAWGNPASTLATFMAVKAAGFSSVRIPITWMGHIGNAPNYEIESSFLDRVAEVVGYAKEAGLIAIINIHHDGANSAYWLDVLGASQDEDTNTEVKAQLSAMWKQIATKFKNEGDYLIFESMNEIQDGGWGWGENLKDGGAQYRVMNEWQQVFVDAVRSVGGENTYRYLGVQGYDTNIDLTVNNLVVPTDVVENRLLVSVHFYDPYTYTLENQQTEWGHTGSDTAGWGDEDQMQENLNKVKSKFLDKNIPVYLGEFGNVHRTTERAESFRKYYLEYLCKLASDMGLALFFWDNGSSASGREASGLIDHGTGEYINNGKDIIDVMVKGYFTTDASYTLQSVYNNAPQ